MYRAVVHISIATVLIALDQVLLHSLVRMDILLPAEVTPSRVMAETHAVTRLPLAQIMVLALNACRRPRGIRAPVALIPATLRTAEAALATARKLAKPTAAGVPVIIQDPTVIPAALIATIPARPAAAATAAAGRTPVQNITPVPEATVSKMQMVLTRLPTATMPADVLLQMAHGAASMEPRPAARPAAAVVPVARRPVSLVRRATTATGARRRVSTTGPITIPVTALMSPERRADVLGWTAGGNASTDPRSALVHPVAVGVPHK